MDHDNSPTHKHLLDGYSRNHIGCVQRNRVLLTILGLGCIAALTLGIVAAPLSDPAPEKPTPAPDVGNLWLSRPALPTTASAHLGTRLCSVRCHNTTAHSALSTACAELASSLGSMLHGGQAIPVLAANGGGSGAPRCDGYAAVRLEDGGDEDAEWDVRHDGDAPELEAFTAKGRSAAAGDDGFPALEVVSPTGRGALFGVHRLLAFLQVAAFAPAAAAAPLRLADIDLHSAPGAALRVWQLWDNLDGTVERGYGGRSVFHWEELPAVTRPRYDEYARVLASVGINVVSLSNVNACFEENQKLLNAANLRKAAALAEIFARHGIATMLAVCFASPLIVAPAPSFSRNVTTADPRDKNVAAWWVAKAAQVATLFAEASRLPWRRDEGGASPFGGFLLKADSEGMPGPATYGRTEPEGANMLGAALAPLRAVVLWRAFAHPADLPGQRGKDQPVVQFDVFKATDGQWDENVVLQIKNGPMDFQTHEPVHSLFGALPNTNVVLELGVTQEYTGQAHHLVHLATQWEEYLRFDTSSTDCVPVVHRAAAVGDDDDAGRPARATLGNIIGGRLPGCPARRHNSGIAGVSNLGEGAAWTGHPLSAANTFAFGRMGWDPPAAAAEAPTAEWIDLTFTGLSKRARARLLSMMMRSWAVYESYTSPLGLGAVDDNCGVVAGRTCGDKGDHYWLNFSKWQATRKPPNAGFGGGFNGSATSIGLNRSATYGATYFGAVAARFARPETTPLGLLLTFHHVPLNFSVALPWTASSTANATTLPLIQALYAFNARGLGEVVAFESEWDIVGGARATAADAAAVGAARFALVRKRLADAAKDARNFTLTAAEYFEQLTGVQPLAARQNQSEGRQGLR